MSDDNITREEMQEMMDGHKKALVQHAEDAAVVGQQQADLLKTMTLSQSAFMTSISGSIKAIDDKVTTLDTKMDSSMLRQGALGGRLEALEGVKVVKKTFVDVAIALVTGRVGLIVAVALVIAVYGTYAVNGVDYTWLKDGLK
jgi:hypothetical protein